MDINLIRDEINKIDDDLLRLFEKRMNLVKNVAEYKSENNMPVFQAEREAQVLRRIGESASDEYINADKIFFNVIMDISKCLQKNQIIRDNAFTHSRVLETETQITESQIKIACSGVAGAYSHIACNKIFGSSDIIFYSDFEDVFEAVERGEADCGILPVQNSNAGSVLPVYALLDKYPFYIIKSTSIKIEHCLAAKKGTDFKHIKDIYSHPQAIAQCRKFIRKHNLNSYEFINTAAAAAMVSEKAEPIAAICSKKSAEIYELDIIKENIQDNNDNYTRFICVSKKPVSNEESNTVTVSLKLPHTQGSLYRFLTAVAVNGVNMTRIESIPARTKNFDVVFYIDFEGNIRDKGVVNLLNDMNNELLYFKYLGNYMDI